MFICAQNSVLYTRIPILFITSLRYKLHHHGDAQAGKEYATPWGPTSSMAVTVCRTESVTISTSGPCKNQWGGCPRLPSNKQLGGRPPHHVNASRCEGIQQRVHCEGGVGSVDAVTPTFFLLWVQDRLSVSNNVLQGVQEIHDRRQTLMLEPLHRLLLPLP
mmetsp:Transcript_149336/g.260821  ORF Transcript_149336/g.260821 Transcript_149336/m.260821 type:complete len:161 (+) Transcript_149336:174-656(+)